MAKVPLVLVDDHPLYVDGLQQMFKRHAEFEVVGVATDGDGLDAILARRRAAVVLMDIEMPKVDGITATAAIHRKYPETKVVILTGYNNPDLIFRAIKAGASGYILKNARKEIVETLRRVVAGEPVLSPDLAGKFLKEFQRDQELEELRRLLQTLSPREEEVLLLVATGASNREIGARLFISELTVKMHLASIFRKLQVNDRTKAAVLALKAGLSAR